MLESHKQKISKIIWVFIFCMPFLDVLTSFFLHFQGRSSYLALGVKVFFLCWLVVLCFLRKQKKLFWYCSAFFVYVISFFLIATKCSSFFLEAQGLFRTFYFPFVFLALFFLQKQGFFFVSKRNLCFLLLIYLVFLIVPEIFHIGFASYAHSKVGGIGWFYSTNEIGGILAILGPFFLKKLLGQKWWIGLLGLFLYLFGILVLGSKAPVLSFGIMVGCFLFSYLLSLWRKKERKKFFLSLFCAFVVSICLSFVLYHSSFYKNIKIHLNFLEIHEVSDLFTFHHIDHFIFSERLSFLKDTHELYLSQSFPRQIFGMGILDISKGVSMKMVEMDVFDIVYHYGLCGLLLFFYPFFNIIKRFKFGFEEKVSLSLILLLCLFTGHILVAPSVSLICSLVLLPKCEEEI